MVAAAALGDIVEQRGDIQQPGLREIGHQLAAERIFVRMLAHGEAAHVAHHHQDVLVDRVDVEQVVLHLADDAAEVRQVAAQDAGLVHAPQRVRDALRRLQDLQEQRAVVAGRGGSLRSILMRACHSARMVRAVMPLSSGCCCQQQEDFQHG